MSQFDMLVDFVKQRFSDNAILLSPGKEIAVDGLIFRAAQPNGLLFKDENGEQAITLVEARWILEVELQK